MLYESDIYTLKDLDIRHPMGSIMDSETNVFYGDKKSMIKRLSFSFTTTDDNDEDVEAILELDFSQHTALDWESFQAALERNYNSKFQAWLKEHKLEDQELLLIFDYEVKKRLISVEPDESW